MTGFEREPRLHSWDDEKVYFWDETGKEWCISDYSDLVARLVEICRDYFVLKAATRSGDEGAARHRF